MIENQVFQKFLLKFLFGIRRKISIAKFSEFFSILLKPLSFKGFISKEIVYKPSSIIFCPKAFFSFFSLCFQGLSKSQR